MLVVIFGIAALYYCRKYRQSTSEHKTKAQYEMSDVMTGSSSGYKAPYAHLGEAQESLQ